MINLVKKIKREVEEFLIACVFLENTEMESTIASMCRTILNDSEIFDKNKLHVSHTSMRKMLEI